MINSESGAYFSGLCILTTALILFLKKSGEITRPSFILSFGVVNSFVSPAIYYALGGQAYSLFSDFAFLDYLKFGCLSVFLYLCLYAFVEFIRVPRLRLFANDTVLLKLYFVLLYVLAIAYYMYFGREMPLLYFLLEDELIARPDTIDYIPLYFSISSIAAITLPCTYLYYYSSIKKYRTHIFFNAMIVFVMIAAGNKGLVAFYAIFMWLYTMGAKVNVRIAVVFAGLMFIYLLLKGITELNQDTLAYMASSPFRRFFVTQGAGFIHRIEMLNTGYLFSSFQNIKVEVFGHMFSTIERGTAPTLFSGDVYAYQGPIASILSFAILSFLFLFTSKLVFFARTNLALPMYWSVFFTGYLLVMSGFSESNFFRILIVGANLILILILGRMRLR